MCQKPKLKFLENRKGTKKRSDRGTAKSILFVNKNVFSVSLCSKYENTIVIILTSGSAIIKPDKIGFFNESQLAKEIIKAENKTFKTKIIIY